MQINQNNFNGHSFPEISAASNLKIIDASTSTMERHSVDIAQLQNQALNMRSIIGPLDTLLKKIDTLDFPESTSMPMLAEIQSKDYDPISLKPGERYPSDHPFSVENWSDFSGLSPEDKEKKIQKFMESCSIQFKNKLIDKDQEIQQSIQQTFSNKGAFKKYLLSMKEHENFQFFITLCAQFYTILSHSENQSVILKMMAQFPPKESDMNCLDGTISRLLSVISALNWELGRGSPLDHFVQEGIEHHFNKIFTDYKLYNSIHKSYQVHVKPYLHHILGVEKEKIIKHDHFFNTPRADLTAESVHAFLSTLQKTVATTIIENLKTEISEFSIHISKQDFSSKALFEIRNSKLMTLIKSMDESFDINNYMGFKIDEDGEMSDTDFQWNENNLYPDIFNILNQSKNDTKKETLVSFEYKDAFKIKNREKIVSALMSDDIGNFGSSVHLLFSLGQKYKGSSPIEFLNLLLSAASHLDKDGAFNRLTVEDRCQTVAGYLKNKCSSSESLHFFSEKIDRIQDRLDVYLRDDQDKNQNIQSYILLLNNKLNVLGSSYLDRITHTLIACHASADTFRSIVGNRIQYVVIKNASKLIAYAPDRKEILQLLHKSMSNECIISLFETVIKINDIEVMQDIFEVFNMAHPIWNNNEIIKSGIFSKVCELYIKNKQFEFVNKHLISASNATHFFTKEPLFMVVIKAIKNGDVSIFNKIIDSMPKKELLKYKNLLMDRTCSLIESGNKEVVELFAQKYFDSNLKNILFDIKKSPDVRHNHDISNAIFKACLNHSTEILDLLYQNGLSAKNIVKLMSRRFSPSVIYDLDSTNLFNRYLRSEIEVGVNKILSQRDHIVMWLLEHGYPLSKFQKEMVDEEESRGYSFIHRCAQKLEFNLLSRMLTHTNHFNDFMGSTTNGGKDVLFLAARAGSESQSALDFIQTALSHPTRTQALSQPDHRGWTPLHEAASKGDVALLTLLLEDTHLSLKNIEAKTRGLFARHTPISAAKNALKEERDVENQQKIEQCIAMLEYKKHELLGNHLSTRLVL